MNTETRFEVQPMILNKEEKWIDLDVKLEDFGVTHDVEIWLGYLDSIRYEISTTFIPSRSEVIKIYNRLINKPTGFLLSPTCVIGGKPFTTVTRKLDTFVGVDGEWYLHNFYKDVVTLPNQFTKKTKYSIRYVAL